MIDLWMKENGGNGAVSRLLESALAVPFLLAALIVLPSCGGSSGSGGDDETPDGPTYWISGEAKSIDHGPLTLQLNGGEELLIDESGAFVFSTGFEEGEEYHVLISEQPEGWVCRIDNNTGQVQNSSVDDISVDCKAQFEIVSDIMQLGLRWVGPSSVNIVYSTDHDCDWENYSLCDDAGMIPDATDGSLSLKAVDDGLDPRKGWFFVLDEGDGFRGPVGARPGPPIPNGHVQAISSDAHRLYIGGAFNHIGMFVGGGAAFDSQSGQPYGALPVVHGLVSAIEPDGEGGWYIGGSFNKVGKYNRKNLARIHENGNVDEHWAPEVDSRVYDLARKDGQVFVAGRFGYANDLLQPHLAAFDAATGVLNEEWRPSINDTVRTIEYFDGSLFVGGEFTEVDGTDTPYISALDVDSGSRRGDWGADVDGLVFEIEASESHLYIAGTFSEVNSVERRQIAALAVGTGQLEHEWEVIVEGRGQGYIGDQMMRSIYLHENTLYLAGDFDHVNDEVRFRLASVDADSGALSDWNPSDAGYTSGQVLSVFRLDDTVYVGGRFGGVAGESRRNLAALDANSAELIAWGPQTSDTVFTIAVQPDSVYVGGRVVGIEGVRTAGLAAMDLQNGTIVDEWAPRVNRPVEALEVVDGAVYVGGKFTRLNGEDVAYLGKLDASSGELNDQWRPDIDDSVYSILLDNDRVYVGGSFSNVNSQSQAGLASLSGHDGAITSNWSGQVDGTVKSLFVRDDTLYVGGSFVSSESEDHENLIALEKDHGGLIEDWSPGITGEVLALAADSDRVFVGGSFDQVDGHSREHIAALHRESGALDQNWSGTVNEAVQSLQLDGERLYVGGRHWRASDQPITAMVAFGATDGEWISEWNPGGHVGVMNRTVVLSIYAVHIANGNVFAGGYGAIDNLGAYDKTNGDVQW